jgi:hypothetical protein
MIRAASALALCLATEWIGAPPASGRPSHPPQAQEAPKPKEPPKKEPQSLFDGTTLKNWKSTEYGGEGKVEVVDGRLVLNMGNSLTGVTWTGADFPKTDYEVRLEAMRVDGDDFFCAIIFPVGKAFCSFVVGGWGGGVVGLSSVDGMNASENETMNTMNFKKGQWYRLRLRVTPKKIEAWIDDKQTVNLDLEGRTISIHPAVELGEPFGLASYETTGAFRKITLEKF